MANWNLEAAAGAPGASLLWRGTWSSALSYNPNNAVYGSNGSSYVSKTNNQNKDPLSNPSDWDLFAAGSQGVQGNVGPAGPPNVLTVSGTTTGTPGSNANVTIAGTSPAQSLAFTIPRGDVGAQGIQGPTGNPGPANVLTVSGTTTGTPGTNANVSISGTSPTQSLAFTIPRGDQGTQGPIGSNAYTTTTANFTMPDVGASVVVNLADTTWVAVGQMVWVQTAGGSPTDAYALKVIAKSGNQVTLLNEGMAGDVTGAGDMTKAVYDANADGIVDKADHVGEAKVYSYQDHFLTGSDASYTNWTAVGGTGAAKAQGASVADHPGIYQIATGTQGGAAATGYGFMTAGNAYILGATGSLVFRAVFKAPATKPTSTAANLSKIYLGMGTQPANGTYPGADFCGFVFDPSSGMANAANNWGVLTRRASVNTYTDTTFVYSTTNWIELVLWIDASGVWPVANTWGNPLPAYGSTAITSNIPLATTPLCMVLHVVNGPSGTTSYQSFIDLWEVAFQPSTSIVTPSFRGASMILG